MEISRIRALRGPNLWSRHTAIEAIVYCTEDESSIDRLPGFENRLRELLSSGQVETKVVAPVPWFFSTQARFGEYALQARTPKREAHNGIDVLHPRYFLPPKVGAKASTTSAIT